MTTTYEAHVATPTGVKLAIIRDFVAADGAALDQVRLVNGIGSLVLVVPVAAYPRSFFAKDARIYLYRSDDGAAPVLEAETWYLVRRVARISRGGRRYYRIRAYDLNHLLKRRIVAYAAGSSQSSKSGAADNLMKDVVDENFVSATDTARNISGLTIQSDQSLGASIAKAFARRNVLTVMQELAAASDKAGTYLAFDVVATSETTFEFRTYTGQRGIDHGSTSGDPILLGPQFGSLANVERVVDWSEEATVVYAGGQDIGAAREMASASDSTLIGESPFGRIEEFYSAIQAASAAALQDDADARLRERRPRRSFTADFVNTPGAPYGQRVNFGDTVVCSVDGEQIDCRVEKVSITVGAGQRTINIQLRSEE